MNPPDHERLLDLQSMCYKISKNGLNLLAREIDSLKSWTDENLSAIWKDKGRNEMRFRLVQLQSEIELLQNIIAGWPRPRIDRDLVNSMDKVNQYFRLLELAPAIEAGRGSLTGGNNGRISRTVKKEKRIAELQKMFDDFHKKCPGMHGRELTKTAIANYEINGGAIPEKTIRDYIRAGKIVIK